MTSAVQIHTHVVDALARLMQQYRGKPKIEAVVTELSAQMQALEDALFDVRDKRSLYTATGVQLDELGTVVSINRPAGLDDDSYRLFVLAKVGQNVSGGETESVIAILSVLTAATTVMLEEHFPASVALYTDGNIVASLGSLVVSLIASSLAAGVSLEYVISGDPTNPFAFDIAGGGFGDDTDPTVGGLLADVLA